jgi:hypothetical protein
MGRSLPASVELLTFGGHRQFVHLKIMLGTGNVLQVEVAIPKLFYDPQRCQIANDDGSGSFNFNTHKATAFQQVCQSIQKMETNDTMF